MSSALCCNRAPAAGRHTRPAEKTRFARLRSPSRWTEGRVTATASEGAGHFATVARAEVAVSRGVDAVRDEDHGAVGQQEVRPTGVVTASILNLVGRRHRTGRSGESGLTVIAAVGRRGVRRIHGAEQGVALPVVVVPAPDVVAGGGIGGV